MPRYDTDLPQAVREVENVWITMSDGCRLAARLFLPEGAPGGPVPAILEYIPYRKRDFMRRRDEGMHRWFAGHGYAVVRVDMRGSGESEGVLHDEYLKQEQDDALEVIAWMARQPWCTGSVGMMGKSWGAYNSVQVAARRPPALKAIIPVMGTDDRYAECIHYSGGCLLNDNFWWGCVMQVFNARPPDPAIVGERWRTLWLERLEAEEFWPAIWLEHQQLDDYWKHGSVCFDYGAIQCPTWFWGGWVDLYRDTPFRLAEHLTVPHRVTVGPWSHLYPHEAVPAPAVGFLQEALRWWDHWLKGVDRGVMREAPLNFYLMESEAVEPQSLEGSAGNAPQSAGSAPRLESAGAARAGRWVVEQRWPSPNVTVRAFALNAGVDAYSHALSERPGEPRGLSLCSPQTTGLAAGDWGSFGNPGDLPGDQRADAFGSLSFTGAPLAERVEMLGNARVVLEIAADRPDAFVAVRLIDVAPGGAASCVARGFLNLTQREGREGPKALVPGERYRVEVALTGTAYAFPAGHRLQVALSSAYWPIVWPSPELVTLTVTTGISQLLLPVRGPADVGRSRGLPPVGARADAEVSQSQLPVGGPADAARAEVELPEAVSAEPSAATGLRPGRVERSVSTDSVTGEVTHRMYVDGGVFGNWGKFRLEDIDLEMAHVIERIYRIRPEAPNSAHASMTQSFEMGRGDWQVTLRTGAEMSSTAESFELTAWLEAREGDTVLCRRDWRSSTPRRLV